MFKIQIIDLETNEVKVDTTSSVIMGVMLCNEKSDDKRACLQIMSFFNDGIENAFCVAAALADVSEQKKRRCVDLVKQRCIGEEVE